MAVFTIFHYENYIYSRIFDSLELFKSNLLIPWMWQGRRYVYLIKKRAIILIFVKSNWFNFPLPCKMKSMEIRRIYEIFKQREEEELMETRR